MNKQTNERPTDRQTDRQPLQLTKVHSQLFSELSAKHFRDEKLSCAADGIGIGIGLDGWIQTTLPKSISAKPS